MTQSGIYGAVCAWADKPESASGFYLFFILEKDFHESRPLFYIESRLERHCSLNSDAEALMTSTGHWVKGVVRSRQVTSGLQS